MSLIKIACKNKRFKTFQYQKLLKLFTTSKKSLQLNCPILIIHTFLNQYKKIIVKPYTFQVPEKDRDLYEVCSCPDVSGGRNHL